MVSHVQTRALSKSPTYLLRVILQLTPQVINLLLHRSMNNSPLLVLHQIRTTAKGKNILLLLLLFYKPLRSRRPLSADETWRSEYFPHFCVDWISDIFISVLDMKFVIVYCVIWDLVCPYTLKPN